MPLITYKGNTLSIRGNRSGKLYIPPPPPFQIEVTVVSGDILTIPILNGYIYDRGLES